MLSVRRERRDFRKSLAALALAGPAVAPFQRLEEAFGAELDTVAHRPRSSVTWEALRDRHMLGPGDRPSSVSDPGPQRPANLPQHHHVGGGDRVPLRGPRRPALS